MPKKKQFFAQDNNKNNAHRAKYFHTLEEATAWLETRGGGTVKKRNAGVVYVFDQPIRVWGEVAKV